MASGNALYYGNNIDVLRESIATESVDLVYLDPPFNSNASYNLLFKSPAGVSSQAQIEAFEDTWHWTAEAEAAFDEVMRSGNTNAADLLRAMRSFLGENDMMAYLAMMAVRLIELHRVLKPTGSLYLHCDPTASHYLKLLLDAVFGPTSFLTKLSGKEHTRTDRQSDTALSMTFCFSIALPRLKCSRARSCCLIQIVARQLELLERLISASSNEGDLVLDPFCGCGTTIHAAQKLGRTG